MYLKVSLYYIIPIIPIHGLMVHCHWYACMYINMRQLAWLQGEPGHNGPDGDPAVPGPAVGGVIAGSHDLIML